MRILSFEQTWSAHGWRTPASRRPQELGRCKRSGLWGEKGNNQRNITDLSLINPPCSPLFAVSVGLSLVPQETLHGQTSVTQDIGSKSPENTHFTQIFTHTLMELPWHPRGRSYSFSFWLVPQTKYCNGVDLEEERNKMTERPCTIKMVTQVFGNVFFCLDFLPNMSLRIAVRFPNPLATSISWGT